MKDDSDVGQHESVIESKDSQNVDAVAVRSVFSEIFPHVHQTSTAAPPQPCLARLHELCI